MVTVAQAIPVPLRLPALREMFEARKRVFVDLLKWDVPVLEGRYEVDQFDDEGATYLIVPREDGSHAGSARLLGTVRPHILDTLFPELCAVPPPRGPNVLEITSEVLTPRRREPALIQDRVGGPERKGLLRLGRSRPTSGEEPRRSASTAGAPITASRKAHRIP
jgi:hypothetical protein